jgi:hypothetical protein
LSQGGYPVLLCFIGQGVKLGGRDAGQDLGKLGGGHFGGSGRLMGQPHLGQPAGVNVRRDMNDRDVVGFHGLHESTAQVCDLDPHRAQDLGPLLVEGFELLVAPCQGRHQVVWRTVVQGSNASF